ADAHLEEALRELLGEPVRARALGQIGVEGDDLGVRLPEAQEAAPVAVPDRDLVPELPLRGQHGGGRRGHGGHQAASGSHVEPSSAIALTISSRLRARPWNSGLPTMKLTPCPFCVSMMSAWGLPWTFSASSSACRMALRSCP